MSEHVFYKIVPTAIIISISGIEILYIGATIFVIKGLNKISEI